MRSRGGFSLVEVTLAIGIIAVALVGIMALIPVSLNSGRDAIDATRSSLIGQDVQTRVKSSVTSTTFSGGDLTLQPWFYDRDGVFVDVTTNGYSSVVYRVDAIIHSTWNAAPPNVDPTVLRPVTVTLGWPINPTTQLVIGNNATSFTFYIRKP